MSVQQTDHSLMQKRSIKFAVMIAVGVVALVLGLALIIFAQYHERAYIFLILGAGSFMGGIAGLIVEGQKVRTALDFSLIAMGIVGIVIGLNYLIASYGPEPNLAHGYLVLTLSIIAILVGLIKQLLVQSKNGFAGIWSVIVLGVIGSMGIVMLLVGTIYLAVLDYPGKAYSSLTLGAVCLVGGIICGLFAQRRIKGISSLLLP